ncbi:MAG TPA: hypothetical protein VGN97_10320 [Mesorhizobium sp.]|jgi:hypothetical protein|nr:hypothetical protein [Mesorhizobium sp.]
MSAVRSFGLVAAAAGAAALGALLAAQAPPETAYLIFVAAAGFAVGSLALLMIGYLMREEWVTPIRAEAEAAALTTPLLVAFALPPGASLGALYPWADPQGGSGTIRDLYLSAEFFRLRGLFYLAVWTGLALWLARARNLQRASAIGLALLAPTAIFAANDWVMFRDPQFWSGLFGFAFTLNELLAALAGAILVSLLRPEHPSPTRMQSLERALLTLALLALWTWFAQFLIIWLGNLPAEAGWYLGRSSREGFWLLFGVALPALVASILILIPPGFGRRTMIVGCALILSHHFAHLLWLAGSFAHGAAAAGEDWLFGAALAALWAAWFTVALRGRPTFASEAAGPA